MFWATAAAIFLLFASFPFWVAAAVIWGILRGLFFFVVYALELVSADKFDAGELLLSPVVGLFYGLEGAWHIPSGIWAWAKFDQPVAATVIAILCLLLLRRD